MRSSIIICCLVVFAAVADASGCGQVHSVGFNANPNNHHIKSSGIDRYYGVYVPYSYNDNPNMKRPLIFDFHGRTGTPEGQYQNSMYYANKEGKEYLVVYPAGLDQAWQGASYARKGVNDLQFVTDLLAHLKENYCIDSDRIYASGMSNGGGFVDTLACSDNGDEFAAFAMAAPALYTDNQKDGCHKQRAILQAHGVVDTTINYHGSPSARGGSIPDIPTWVSWWGQRDQCDAQKDKSQTGDLGGYDITSYSCHGFNKVVEHYQIYKLGHCWASSNGQNTDSKNKEVCGDRSLDYTSVVVGFFSRWNENNKP